jgi:hypothetical protein
MAIFCHGQRCLLCDQPITEGEVFGTWGVWLPTNDPLWKFCDGVMHWNCYASWPHRKRFASTYFEFWVRSEEQNAFWHRAYLDDEFLVTVNPFAPVEAAWVHLKDTGSRLNVNFKNWEAWLTAEPEATMHPVLAQAVDGAKRMLREQFPSSEQLVAGINKSRKMAVVEKHQAAEKTKRDEQRELQRQLNPHNAACNRMMNLIQRDGMTCPHCHTHSKGYRLSSRSGHKSAVICTHCGWAVDPNFL